MKRVKLLRFRHKQYRAEIIRRYMEFMGYKKAVCFSCGNAAMALKAAGVEVLYIGETGDLAPNKWWRQEEVKKWFPDCFDATSGHLPIPIMKSIGVYYTQTLGDVGDEIYVPTGSGETLVALKLAWPNKKFIAVYNLDKATEYDEDAPLNPLVQLLAEKVIFADKVKDIIFE